VLCNSSNHTVCYSLFSLSEEVQSVCCSYVGFASGSVLVIPNISFFLALVMVKQDEVRQQMAILSMGSLLLASFTGLISALCCRVRNRPEKERYPSWHCWPRHPCCGFAFEISSQVLPPGQLLYWYAGPVQKVSFSSSYLILCSTLYKKISDTVAWSS
jgi:hypothetical protein